MDFSQLGLRERQDIQEWAAANPSILGQDLLIVSKELSGFDRTNERLDLLAVDSDGRLVIIELKRDDTGADAHWQAIKYASYLHRASAEEIIRMMADYEEVSAEDASERLLKHLHADDFNSLNNDQRIVLASHRFAPEVTSAALWLNEKAPGESLITCVQLTPYRDANTGALYIQATTIIPVPGVDDYVISIGDNSQQSTNRKRSNFAVNLKNAYDRNRNDEVTTFVTKISHLTLKDLAEGTRPDKTGKWAGGWPHYRYYNLWYSRGPWRNHRMCYYIHLRPHGESNEWQVDVGFTDEHQLALPSLNGVSLHERQTSDADGVQVSMEPGELNDDFAMEIADTLRQFIAQITPIVDDLGNESDEAVDNP